MPYWCCLCEHPSDQDLDLCSMCAKLLPRCEDRCYRCGLRLQADNNPIFCQGCHENPPKFDRLCSLFDYQSPALNLITGLKFGRQLALGKVLGELLASAINLKWYHDKNAFPEAVIPVPLHKSRLRYRGFNQSLELLRPLKKQTQIEISACCRRVKPTRTQSGLKAEFRRQNLKNAFDIIKPIDFKHVAILDDVVTTGSTVNSLSNTLKNAGVEQIDVWCICRG